LLWIIFPTIGVGENTPIANDVGWKDVLDRIVVLSESNESVDRKEGKHLQACHFEEQKNCQRNSSLQLQGKIVIQFSFWVGGVVGS
jgi:hypothetical protein